MRPDLDIIQHWIEPGSRVLDLGCGDGSLLEYLKREKGVSELGLEIDERKIHACLEKGVNVIQQDLDKSLTNFCDKSFDTVLLTQRAHEAGASILTLTDRPTSPVAPMSSVILYAQTDSAYFANSEATVATLVEALTSAVQRAAKGSLNAATQLVHLLEPWLHDARGPRLHAQGLKGRRSGQPQPAAPGKAPSQAADSRPSADHEDN